MFFIFQCCQHLVEHCLVQHKMSLLSYSLIHVPSELACCGLWSWIVCKFESSSVTSSKPKTTTFPKQAIQKTELTGPRTLQIWPQGAFVLLLPQAQQQAESSRQIWSEIVSGSFSERIAFDVNVLLSHPLSPKLSKLWKPEASWVFCCCLPFRLPLTCKDVIFDAAERTWSKQNSWERFGFSTPTKLLLGKIERRTSTNFIVDSVFDSVSSSLPFLLAKAGSLCFSSIRVENLHFSQKTLNHTTCWSVWVLVCVWSQIVAMLNCCLKTSDPEKWSWARWICSIVKKNKSSTFWIGPEKGHKQLNSIRNCRKLNHRTVNSCFLSCLNLIWKNKSVPGGNTFPVVLVFSRSQGATWEAVLHPLSRENKKTELNIYIN